MGRPNRFPLWGRRCDDPGGYNQQDNLVVACRECNAFKCKTVDAALIKIKRKETGGKRYPQPPWHSQG